MSNNTVQASILVVSRTPELLNRLLASLNQGYRGEADRVEVLASWNGSREQEWEVQPGRLPFRIAQRDPYHFARNMNSLARLARGQTLIFANDDLIVDPGAIDVALERLATQPEVGIVGAQLRRSDGGLAHAGIHFTSYGSPYHQLEHFASIEHSSANRERLVPAVTGAFFAMRREEFLQLELAETFRVCGEDILLNLQMRSLLQKQVLYCPAMSGIHNAESTRSHFEDQQTSEDDMKRMRTGWLEMLQRADRPNLLVELEAAQDEAEALRAIILQQTALMTATERELAEMRSSAAAHIRAQTQLQAEQTKQNMRQSLLESENKRLRTCVQQLENQLLRERGQPG